MAAVLRGHPSSTDITAIAKIGAGAVSAEMTGARFSIDKIG